MPERIFVRPKRGLVVPNPTSGNSPFDAAGQYILRDNYVNRRITEGDLIEIPADEAETIIEEQRQRLLSEQEAEAAAEIPAEPEATDETSERRRGGRRKSGE